jgi:hypothetical protein
LLARCANALNARVAQTCVDLRIARGPRETDRAQTEELTGAHGRALASVLARIDVVTGVDHVLAYVACVAGHARACVASGCVGVQAQASVLAGIGGLAYAYYSLAVGARVAEWAHALDVGRCEFETRAAVVARH